MVQIEAFQGLRYDLAHVGSLSDVVAPPYDVIDPDLRYNVIKKSEMQKIPIKSRNTYKLKRRYIYLLS